MVNALDHVNLNIDENEIVVFLGPTGCGKTTLLRIIGGLLTADEGQVMVNGKRVAGPGPDRGFVFQNFRLMPWRTIMDNVCFPLEFRRTHREERRKAAKEYLKLVGLGGFEESYPFELSGGMQQRVALARALIIDPEILLMDEPFASLDAQTREIMQTQLLKLLETKRKTVLFVTHSLDEALALGDRIVVMTARPGKVAQIIQNKLPKPRYEYDIRSKAEFVEQRELMWNLIKEQVTRQLGMGS